MGLFFLLGLPALLILIEFVAYLATGSRLISRWLLLPAEFISLILLPCMYAEFGTENDCCSDSAVFSPDHYMSIVCLMVFCLVAYFYSGFRKKIAPPVLEVTVNAFLLIGIGLNIAIGIHTKDPSLATLGNGPIILCGMLALVKNQKLFLQHAQETAFSPSGRLETLAWEIMNLKPMLKYPVLLLLCLPLLALISAFLMLVGQKPDSMIRAFTETYKHGLSQWDYKCDNVQCGGHYLCSVAAKGHPRLVQPQRLGFRNGQPILCNRQLLVSNAFEDLMQEKFPFLHARIRREYNKVGRVVHRYYGIFNNKWVSDLVYLAMKPLEWFFLLTLYSFDRNPENRISRQYL